jgi:hypothetical protein
MKSKLKSSSTPVFAKGGSGKMAGKTGVGTQKAGVTAKDSGMGGKFMMGGKGKMAGKSGAAPAKKR